MKAEWEEYLREIDILEPFAERVTAVLSFYDRFYPGITEDLFVTEYVGEDGNRNFENLWLLGPSMMNEAKNFLEEDDFDAVILPNQVRYWNVKKKDFEPGEANSKSRLTVRASLKSDIEANLRASGTNCDHLWQVFIKYIKPNLKSD